MMKGNCLCFGCQFRRGCEASSRLLVLTRLHIKCMADSDADEEDVDCSIVSATACEILGTTLAAFGFGLCPSRYVFQEHGVEYAWSRTLVIAEEWMVSSFVGRSLSGL